MERDKRKTLPLLSFILHSLPPGKQNFARQGIV